MALSSTNGFDPSSYEGALSSLSSDQLRMLLNHKEPGTPGYLAVERTLDTNQNDSDSSKSETDLPDAPPGGWDHLNRRSKLKSERDMHEANAAELREQVQQLRVKVQELGADPDRVLKDTAGRRWKPPIPLSTSADPDPLPLDAFPKWLGDHIRSVSEFVQVSADLCALLGLGVLSGALQKKVVVQPRPGWIEPISIWGAGVLESGTRKSPAFELMSAPIREYEQKRHKEVREKLSRAQDQKEVLQARLDRAKKRATEADGSDRESAERKVQKAREELENHDVPSLPQLWVDDVTSEALLQVLEENHGRALAMSPEGDFFKYIAGRYSTGDAVMNVYKKAWGGEPLRDNRVSREGSNVANPALAVAISLQPQVLEDLAQKRTFRGEGLLARFLFAVPPSIVGRRKTGREVPPLDEEAEARYRKHLLTLLELDPKTAENGDWQPHKLSLSEEALTIFSKFQEESERMLLPGNDLDGITDWGSKLPGHALRIAGVLHVADNRSPDGPMHGDTMRNSVRLARGFIPHAKAAYGMLDANQQNKLAQYVWCRICDTIGIDPDLQRAANRDTPLSANTANIANGRSLSKRELFESTKGKSAIGSVGDLKSPLRQLEEHNLIQIVDRVSDGPGRPASPEIYVNPLLSD